MKLLKINGESRTGLGVSLGTRRFVILAETVHIQEHASEHVALSF